MAKKGSYGIKEVADVSFYPVNPNNYITTASLGQDGKVSLTWSGSTPTAVYEFDSLKVSNIEVASEETSAKGGKGNPELISWSYGKTATLTITDALISMSTLDLMFGAKEDNITDATNTLTIDANSFPVPYQIVGTTVMRSYETGKDEPFIFYIPKAQVQVGGTLTMEAEGDPSTFEMSIKALAQDLGENGVGGKDVLVQFIRIAK